MSLQNAINYTEKQSVEIPFKHNFILHLILLIISIFLFISNIDIKYLNICLCIYLMCLLVYLLYVLIQTKIPKRQVYTCYTSWDLSNKEQLSICFTYDKIVDYHTISIGAINRIYWCSEYRAFIIVYKTLGTFPCLVPFLVHSPYSHSVDIMNLLSSLYGVETTKITHDQMISVLTKYPH